MKKKQKTKRFSLQGFDNKHYQTTQQYVNAVNALFDRATNEIAQVASKATYDHDKPFSFDDYPQTKSKVQNITASLASNITSVVERGSRKQWLFACQKNDDFVASIMDTSKLSKARLDKMQDRNLDALQTFQNRKVNGMELSKRVWLYTEQYKAQIELGIDVGIGDGTSAQQLAKDLKKNLKDPDRLFRRVRDKRGNLQLSKAAKAFHPGQGVYRSSTKNAQRLTRSEINMAYRESDWLRWQQLDFVVGFEIKVSNRHEEWLRTVWNKSNKGKVEICDQLKGKYPKTFKFKGWHPQCMCYVVPILEDYFSEERSDDRVNRLKAALNGTEYKKYVSKETVTNVPQGFKDWVEANEQNQANWKSSPYFIKDNFKGGQIANGLNINVGIDEIINKPTKFIVQTQQEDIANGQDSPHPAMKTDYPDALSVKDTIKAINDELQDDKWFENGVGDLLVETNSGSNGATNRATGKIWLTKIRIDNVRSAMTKIGQGKSVEITTEEADAMATYWHEITHNRNGTAWELITSNERKYMELANEYVARKTLPEFYKKLGCGKTPHPEFMTSRSTTGYNTMVNNYDFVVSKLGLDEIKVLDSVRKQLYNESYKKQSDGLYQGLIDGGLKKIDGSKVKKSEINKLLVICRDDSKLDVDTWLKNNGFLAK